MGVQLVGTQVCMVRSGVRVSLTRLDDDVDLPFRRISFKVFSDFQCRVQCIVTIQLDFPQLMFVATPNLHFPELEGEGIVTLQTDRVISNDGLLELINGLLAADVNRKTVFVTIDPAEQGYHVRHPG